MSAASSTADASRTYRVPAGAPACLQILTRLDAGGYQVVVGTRSAVVQPASCMTTEPNSGVSPDAGAGTILAAGGSHIALTWTSDTYTVTVKSP